MMGLIGRCKELFVSFRDKRLQVSRAGGFLNRARRGHTERMELIEAIARFRRSPYWEVRNIGVKLCGLLGENDQSPWLLELLSKRSDKGFLRRNAADSLRAIGTASTDVLMALMHGLEDPYWEVRSVSALALADLAQGDAAIEEALLTALAAGRKNRRGEVIETNFDVRRSLAVALGAHGSSASFAVLPALLTDPNWQVRNAALETCHAMYRRGIIDQPALAAAIQQVDITAEGFKPVFTLSATYRRLLGSIDGRDEPRNGSEVAHGAVSEGDD
ncbi:HEAT repeat domain-containing protein [bacterium]|nr:HEAT repeat domain-containing protein [candidate division CSSED10-310 bacterium]